MGELECLCHIQDDSAGCILHGHIAIQHTVEHLKLQIVQAQLAGVEYDTIYNILRTLSDVGYFVS